MSPPFSPSEFVSRICSAGSFARAHRALLSPPLSIGRILRQILIRSGSRFCSVQIGGLSIATVVTPVLVPVLYANSVLDLKLVKWEASLHRGARGRARSRPRGVALPRAATTAEPCLSANRQAPPHRISHGNVRMR